jgi:hypothetical protein
MYDYEFRRQFAQDRLARLSRDWSTGAPRRRVRLALGRWLIGAGRRLAPAEASRAMPPEGRAALGGATASRSAFSHEALPRC